jgi:hypothetical protein
MTTLTGLPLPDLAALICQACSEKGIEVVLSGGACVSIYTENRYASFDLDFVLRSAVPRKTLRSVMESLDFREDGRHFRHPETPYIVEFLSPPLSVGGEPVREISKIRRGKNILKLLSPTDCVKDRLAAFYHWNDRPSLDQAVLVSRDSKVDLREVKRWSIQEDMEDKFALFKKELAKMTQTSRKTPAGRNR